MKSPGSFPRKGAASVLGFFALLAFTVPLAGCGLLAPSDDNPLWGVWSGPYPSSLGSQADSSRFVFTSRRVYLFYALKTDGTILAREVGYFSSNGYLATLSSDPGGTLDREELYYELIAGSLAVTIRGERVVFRRVGNAAQADDLGSAAHLMKGAPTRWPNG